VKMKRVTATLTLHCSLVWLIALGSCAAQENSSPRPQADASAGGFQAPDLLSFEDLIALASTAKPSGALSVRFNTLLNTPFIQSERSTENIQPHRPQCMREWAWYSG
jgi:hypothetical protein